MERERERAWEKEGAKVVFVLLLFLLLFFGEGGEGESGGMEEEEVKGLAIARNEVFTLCEEKIRKEIV